MVVPSANLLLASMVLALALRRQLESLEKFRRVASLAVYQTESRLRQAYEVEASCGYVGSSWIHC